MADGGPRRRSVGGPLVDRSPADHSGLWTPARRQSAAAVHSTTGMDVEMSPTECVAPELYDETVVNMLEVHRLFRRHVNKGYIFKELIPYCSFLFIILLVVFLGRSEVEPASVHRAIDSIKDNLVDNTYDMTPDLQFSKTFWDTVTEVDFWRWVEGPLLANLVSSTGGSYSIGGVTQPLGYVILRQQRVRSYECANDTAFNAIAADVQPYLPRTCFPDYRCDLLVCNLDTTPYGPNGTFTALHDDTSDEGLEFPTLQGHYRNYGNNAYNFVEKIPVESPQGLAGALARARVLKENGWVDAATRMIAVETILFNRNMGLFVRFIGFIEISAGGEWEPMTRFIAFRFIAPDSVRGGFLMFFDILVTIYIVYVFYRILQGLYRNYKLHHEIISFFTFFNSYALSDMLLFIVTYGYRWHLWHITFKYSTDRHTQGNSPIEVNTMYRDLASAGALYETQWTHYAWATAIAIGGLFRFTQYNPRLFLLVNTIERALGELISVTMMLTLVICAYAILGNVIFGYANDDFQTWSRSCGTLLLHLVGYGEWDLNAPDVWTETLYFFTYYFFAWAILLNMILAVINESLSAVKNKSGITDTHIIKSLQELSKRTFAKWSMSEAERMRLAEKEADRKAKEANRGQIVAQIYEKLKAHRTTKDWRDQMLKKELRTELNWTEEEWELMNGYLDSHKDDVYEMGDNNQSEKEKLEMLTYQVSQIGASISVLRPEITRDIHVAVERALRNRGSVISVSGQSDSGAAPLPHTVPSGPAPS